MSIMYPDLVYFTFHGAFFNAFIYSSTIRFLYPISLLGLYKYFLAGFSVYTDDDSRSSRNRSTRVAPVSLRVPSIEAGVKKRSCNLVFDILQDNVCDAMRDYFVINAHGRNTRNGQHLVKIPQVKTEIGRKGSYYLAGKEFNDLPLSARKIESRLLFRRFLENHFI